MVKLIVTHSHNFLKGKRCAKAHDYCLRVRRGFAEAKPRLNAQPPASLKLGGGFRFDHFKVVKNERT